MSQWYKPYIVVISVLAEEIHQFSYELGCGVIFEETDSEAEPPEDKRRKNKRLKTLKYTPRLEAPAETVEELVDPRPPRKRAYVDISADHPLSARSSSPDYYVWDAVRSFCPRTDSFI
jgi:hypothetical protein